MAGIYIHIPYCKQACHYCDFHFSTNHKTMDDMVQAIKNELTLRADYLGDHKISTIYFGGGTPSVLNTEGLNSILSSVSDNYQIIKEVEIALEANPDDLTFEKCSELIKLGFNRLSIGIQSFDDQALKLMNRAHTSEEAMTSIRTARSVGFNNISLDLIFGTPPIEGSFDRLKTDLDVIVSINPEHVSVYGLTIEPQTAFGKWHEKGEMKVPGEDDHGAQFEYLSEFLYLNDYEHYEVSNFCRAGFESKHNSSYWKNERYLGVGPGAHSYNGSSRSFNVSNNPLYIKALLNNKHSETIEKLDDQQKLNEYLLTRIRTKWGINLETLKDKWDYNVMEAHANYINQLIDSDRAIIREGNLTLTTKGFQIADDVTLRLFN